MVRHVRAAIDSEGWCGDCWLECSAVTKARLGEDREASGAARSVRWLWRRNGAVTFLKTVKGRTETSQSSRVPSSGRAATGAPVRQVR